MDLAIFALFSLFLISFYFLLIRSKKTSKRVPPGSLGLPFIGHSLKFVRALRNNTAEAWLQGRVQKYGPVSKMSLLGKPTVFVHGTGANKFIYTCDDNMLANQRPYSIRTLCGGRNMAELSGEEHKRMRGAIVSFLRPEMLKYYVGKMDLKIRKYFNKHWHGKHKISAMPSMKSLTFNIMSSLIFGIEDEVTTNKLVEPFERLMEGMLAIPINFPFTRFSRSLKGRSLIKSVILELIKERRAALEQQTIFPQHDLITTLLSIKTDGNPSSVYSDEDIVDNTIFMMIAGHDTISNLLSFMIKILADDPSVYANVVQEQEEILKSKGFEELLTWDDLARMKYTWRVAMEALRMTPPVFSSLRKVLQDFEYEGYVIPKGWQVFWAPCMTHMDETIFSNPTKFDPTRFGKQAGSAAVLPYSLIPFGGGPRICPGTEFARIETLVAIHYLVTRFTWKLSCPQISYFRDPMPTFKDGLEIQIQQKQVN